MFKLIQRMSVPRKLTLVSMSFLIPDFVLMCMFLVAINGYIDFAQQELNGNEYLRPLEALLDSIPQHLQLVRRSRAGDAQSAERLTAMQANVDAAFDRLLAVDARLGESLQFTTEGLASRQREKCRADLLAQRWQELKQKSATLDDPTCEARHRSLLADVRTMIGHAGDTSNLILDPDLDSYYLMDITLLALPQMQERLAWATSHGESRLRRGIITDEDRSQFKVDAAMLQEADLNRIMASARTALNEDRNFYGVSDSLPASLLPELDRLAASATTLIALMNRLADDEHAEIGLEEWGAASDAVRSASVNLWSTVVEELDRLLQTRIDHYRRRRAWSVFLAGLAFTAAILLVTLITRSISRPLQQQANQLREASAAYQESERRAHAVIEAAPDCVVTMNDAGNIVEFNQAAERMFGFRRGDVVGRPVADTIVPHHFRESHRQGLERFLRSGEGAVFGRRLELVGLRADESEFPIEIAISAVDGNDAPTFIAFIRDITRRKEAENELKRLYTESQLVLASISSVLIHLDTDGVVTRWNAAAETIFGLPADEAIGRRCRDLAWQDPKVPQRLEELAREHGSDRFPHVAVAAGDGREFILDLTVNPICAEGRCTGLLVLGNDRTEQAQLEVTLRQSQRLESIGQLAAGIAHEINTPMQFVNDNIEFLSECSTRLFEVVVAYERNLSPSGPQRSWQERTEEIQQIMAKSQFEHIRQQVPAAIAESKEGIKRVINIVRAMKEFSHPGGVEMVNADLNEAIRSTAAISRNRWKYVADLELVLDPDLPHVDCLLAEINQVLLNVIVNASDAIAEKVGASGEDKGRITVRTRADNDDYITIEVEDTGCGIPPEIRSRIFDPFFTTKEVGKGTGQGLAICYNVIVNMHHGTIKADSARSGGAMFVVTIPIIAAKSAPDDADEQFSTASSQLTSALID